VVVRSAADIKIQVVVFTNRGAYTLFICASYRMGTLWGVYFMSSHPLAFRLTCDIYSYWTCALPPFKHNREY